VWALPPSFYHGHPLDCPQGKKISNDYFHSKKACKVKFKLLDLLIQVRNKTENDKELM
jgi:hypothetical protein